MESLQVPARHFDQRFVLSYLTTFCETTLLQEVSLRFDLENNSSTPLFVQTLLRTWDCSPVVFLAPFVIPMKVVREDSRQSNGIGLLEPSTLKICLRSVWGDRSISARGSQFPTHHDLLKQKSQQTTDYTRSVQTQKRNLVAQVSWSMLRSYTKQCLGSP